MFALLPLTLLSPESWTAYVVREVKAVSERARHLPANNRDEGKGCFADIVRTRKHEAVESSQQNKTVLSPTVESVLSIVRS